MTLSLPRAAVSRIALLVLLLGLGAGCPTRGGNNSGGDDDDATGDDDDATGDDDDATGDDDDATGDDDDATAALDWTTLWATGRALDDGTSLPFLVELDPTTGAELARISITTTVPDVSGTNGLAWAPDQSALYVVLRAGGNKGGAPPGRHLARLDPVTGVATTIGLLAPTAADIAFGPDGTLYAVAGQQPAPSLWTVSTVDATATQVGSDLVNDQDSTDGEAIAFDWNGGLIYRLTGNDPYNFYSVVPSTAVETEITLTGLASDARNEATAMAWDPNSGAIHFVDRGQGLATVTTAGVQALIGATGDDDFKGLTWGP